MQLVYSLPSNYKVSVVAYATDIVLQTDLVDYTGRDLLAKQVKNISYGGYTNAGAGLKIALQILSGTSQSHIVMLSDGEILLKGDTATNNARAVFAEQIQLAKNSGIRVDFVGFADETLIDSKISVVADATKGSTHYAPKAIDIQKTIDDILINQLQVKKSTLGIIESDGIPQKIKVDLPTKNMSKVRLLLTSTNPITNLVADFGAENSLQDSGSRYALIELDYPTRETVNIEADRTADSKIKVGLFLNTHHL